MVEFHLIQGVTPSYGRVYMAVDASKRVFAHECSHVKPQARVRRPLGLAGPWSRTVDNRIFCTTQKGALRFQINPVRSKGRTIGNRLFMWSRLSGDTRAVVVVDATLTRRGGGIFFDPGRCARNTWP